MFGLTGGVLAAWVVSHLGGSSPHHGTMASSALLAFVLIQGLSVRVIPAPALCLRWDGQQWSAGHEPCKLELMMHLRRCVLLRLRASTGPRWVVVGRREAGPAWHGLLVALHGQAPATAAGFAEGQAG